MSKQIVKSLLLEAGKSILRRKKEEAKRGIGFNIFRILKRHFDEVNGHSAFISALLNPNGAHGQGAKFLDIFIDKLKRVIESDTDSEFLKGLVKSTPLPKPSKSWQVTVEKHFSREDSGTSRSNSIDILIKTPEHAIVIENKINAEDQPNQLWRYKQSIAHSYKNTKIILVYLTKSGYQPAGHSLKKENNAELADVDISEILCLSYETFIMEWIKECVGVVPLIPHIRETLFQYQIILRQITGQGGVMSNAVKEVLTSNSQFFHTSLEMFHGVKEAKIELQTIFWDYLKDKLEELIAELNEEEVFKSDPLELYPDYNPDQIRDFHIKKGTAQRNRPYDYGLCIWVKGSIAFQFVVSENEELYCGLWKYQNKDSGETVSLPESDKIKEKLSWLDDGDTKIYIKASSDEVTIESDKWNTFFNDFGTSSESPVNTMETHVKNWADEFMLELDVGRILLGVAETLSD